MANSQFEALHLTREATDEILAGYEKATESEDHEGESISNVMMDLHRKHSGELLDRQSALGYSTDGEAVDISSPEWITVQASGPLHAIKRGEKELLRVYQEALTGWAKSQDTETFDLIEKQYQELVALEGSVAQMV